MMRESFAAVVERNSTMAGSFVTEPYEVGWAGEVRCFVRVLDVSPDTVASFTTQISPDGLVWCDHEVPTKTVSDLGLISWPVRECGQWIRLSGDIQGTGDSWVKLMIYIVLKA